MKERVITSNIVRNDMFLMACEGYIKTLSTFIVEYSFMNEEKYIRNVKNISGNKVLFCLFLLNIKKAFLEKNILMILQ